MFTSDDFIAEAYKLAKPGVYLSPEGEGEVAAIWGGDGVVKPAEGTWQHWISINCQMLPHDEFSLTGWLSLYTRIEAQVSDNEPDDVWYEHDFWTNRIIHDTDMKQVASGYQGIPLYAREALLLAPPDFVCRAGAQKVNDWLRSIEWQPEWGEPRHPVHREVTRPYHELYMKQSIFNPDTPDYAFLNGYNLVYINYERILRGESLVLCTLKDAEPYFEVWRDKAGNIEVVPQIT